MNGEEPLPPCPRLDEYEKQARKLKGAFDGGDCQAMRWIRRYHPDLSGRPDTNDRKTVTESKCGCPMQKKIRRDRRMLAALRSPKPKG